MDEVPLETGCLSLLELSLLELSLLELSLLDRSILQTRCRLVLCQPTWSRRPTSSLTVLESAPSPFAEPLRLSVR